MRVIRDSASMAPRAFDTPRGALEQARGLTAPASDVPTQRRTRGPRKQAPDVPLGSILHASVRGQERRDPTRANACGGCAGTQLSELPIVLTDGTQVAFVTCNRCAHTGWFATDGAKLSLQTVLGRATVRKDMSA